MSVVGMIPARLASSRLPRKLLLQETGKPLIQYAWECAKRAKLLDEVIVACDCLEIFEAVQGFGAKAVMTGTHSSGSDRLAEAVSKHAHDARIVVNIQGDEPELDPSHIDLLVKQMLSDPAAEMATLASPITDIATLLDPNCVKVIRSAIGTAIYFSRLPIPFVRDQSVESLFSSEDDASVSARRSWLQHIGIYAYRKDFLLAFTKLPVSPLEELEKLEQLRALDVGTKIRVEVVSHRAVGIDTRPDYDAFIKRERLASRRAAA